MRLQNKIRDSLEEDLRMARGMLSGICDGARNLEVMDPDYLSPTINLRNVVGLDDERGSFAHYQNIVEVLTEALEEGKISSNQAVSIRAPGYLCELVADNKSIERPLDYATREFLNGRASPIYDLPIFGGRATIK